MYEKKWKILYTLLFLTYLYTFSIKYVIVGIIYFVSYLMDMSFYCLIGGCLLIWDIGELPSLLVNLVAMKYFTTSRESKFEIS